MCTGREVEVFVEWRQHDVEQLFGCHAPGKHDRQAKHKAEDRSWETERWVVVDDAHVVAMGHRILRLGKVLACWEDAHKHSHGRDAIKKTEV